jgi:hypothetical protein
MEYQVKKDSAAYPLVFLMIDASDHISGKTGLSPAVTLSKNGATFAAPAGALTEIGNGWYKVAGHVTDTNTLGPLVLHASATGADPVDGLYVVVAYDPQDAVRGGLTALPNVASGSAGAIPTTGSGANQIQVNGTGAISSVVSVAACQDLLEADRVIDTTVAPWALVLIKKGSGALGQSGAVELLRQKLRDVNGAPVSNANTILGQSVT